MGDPASIGPEIAIKALLNEKVHAICRPLIVGDAGVFNDIINRLKLPATVNAAKTGWPARQKFWFPVYGNNIPGPEPVLPEELETLPDLATEPART